MSGRQAGNFPLFVIETAFTPDPMAAYIEATFSNPGAAGDTYLYEDMTSLGDYTVQAGDYLEYDVYVPSASNPASPLVGGMDLGASDGSYVSGVGSGAIDQDGNKIENGPSGHLDVWYHRRIPLPASFVGKTITKWDLASEHDSAGAQTTLARYRDILITDGAGTVRRPVWRQLDQLPTFAVDKINPAGQTMVATRSSDPAVYTDISSYPRALSTRRGRQHELDRVEAGTATVRLSNRDRRFDPSNVASPYFPNLVPDRRIRISAIAGGVTYYIFTGFIEAWPQARRGPRDYETTLECSDAFALFANMLFSTQGATWPQELSGARINRVLDAFGWPAADRLIDAGLSTVQGVTIDFASKQDVLSHLLDVADAELGTLWIDGQGRVVFRDRRYRWLTQASPLATFADSGFGVELPYRDLNISFDKDQIFNEVTVRPANHAESTRRTASDFASQVRYSRRSLVREPLLFNDLEADDQANYLLARFSQPVTRVADMQLDGKLGDAVVAQILGRDLGDKVTVKWTPPGAGAPLAQDSHIEYVALDVAQAADKKRQLQCTWQMSPADTQSYWVLGDAVNGVLGSTARLGY